MSQRINSPTRLITIAIAIGLLFNWMFFEKSLGVSAFIFTAGTLTALYATGVIEGIRPNRRNSWLIVPTLFFASMLFLRAAPFLVFLNIMVVLFLLMLQATFYQADQVDELGVMGYVVAPITTMFHSVFGGMQVAVPAARQTLEKTGDGAVVRRNLVPVLRGVLLAVPVLGVFTLLLISADTVFEQRLGDLFDIFEPEQVERLIAQTFIVLWIAWLAAGALVYALTRDDQATIRKLNTADGAADDVKLIDRLRLGFTESIIVLNAVNLLFGFFLWVQATYLFGGAANVVEDGYTYAEYARRGFFELVAVAVLTLGLILVLKTMARRESNRQMIVFNLSSSLIVVFATVMLVSAHNRLSLYELTYGFTELRVYSHVFMVWLGVALAWFVLTLWFRPNRFAIGLFICALGFAATLNLMNPHQFIVEQNWQRFELLTAEMDLNQLEELTSFETATPGDDNFIWRYDRTYVLDIRYISRLSADAVPALFEIDNLMTEDHRLVMKDYLLDMGKQLANDEQNNHWQAYHLSEQKALALLSAEFGPQALDETNIAERD